MPTIITATLTRKWAERVMVDEWDGRNMAGLREAFAQSAYVDLRRQGIRMSAGPRRAAEPAGHYTHTREPDGSWTIQQEIS